MTIRSRFTAGGMAAALALGGVTAAAVGTSWAAAAEPDNDSADQTEDGTTEGTSLVERITDALAGLVADGTITDEQASSVARTLADADVLRPPHGFGHHGPGMAFDGPGVGVGGPGMAFAVGALDVAAETLGMGEEELLSALRDGQSLAEVAEEQGIAVDDLVDALVAAAQERLDEAGAGGDLTQERADELVAELPERVAEAVERGFDAGPGPWHGDRRWDDAPDEAPSTDDAPDEAPSTDSAADV